MYRAFLLVLLSTHAALGAPQENRDSSITYLKIQPQATDRPVDTQNYRTYRFVPSSKTAKKFNKTQSSFVLSDDQKDLNKPSELDIKNKSSDLSEKLNTPDVFDVTESILEHSTNKPNNQNVSTTIATEEPVIDTKVTDAPPVKEEKADNDPEIDALKEHKNLYKDKFENLDTDPSESSQFDRHSRDYDYTTASYDSGETEIADYSTEKYEDLDDTKSPSKISPKLTYFQKFGGSFSNNLIESSGKRRFRSRCRCEKIWNCPKLQISVPRCPEEYFMCCF